MPGKIIQGLKKSRYKSSHLADEIDKIGLWLSRWSRISDAGSFRSPIRITLFNDHLLRSFWSLRRRCLLRRQTFYLEFLNPCSTVWNFYFLSLHRNRKETYCQAIPYSRLENHGLVGEDRRWFGCRGFDPLLHSPVWRAKSQREIATLVRKAAKKYVEQGDKESPSISAPMIWRTNWSPSLQIWFDGKDWSSRLAKPVSRRRSGSNTLLIECTVMPGRGKVTVTGRLGDVMQESAQAAYSYVRSRAGQPEFQKISTAKWTFTSTCRRCRSKEQLFIVRGSPWPLLSRRHSQTALSAKTLRWPVKSLCEEMFCPSVA